MRCAKQRFFYFGDDKQQSPNAGNLFLAGTVEVNTSQERCDDSLNDRGSNTQPSHSEAN